MDLGIAHFDLANNYGPLLDSAEDAFGDALQIDFSELRDELIVSTKAGCTIWNGPIGDYGSRKGLITICDQSFKRLGLGYIDILYHHRSDPEARLGEAMGSPAQIMRLGKALQVGPSKYPDEQTRQAVEVLQDFDASCLIHQPRYSMMDRWVGAGR